MFFGQHLARESGFTVKSILHEDMFLKNQFSQILNNIFKKHLAVLAFWKVCKSISKSLPTQSIFVNREDKECIRNSGKEAS
jgi:hypothetical protein